MSDISIYSLVLFVHITSAIALIGSSLFAPLVRKLIVEAASAGELKTALHLARRSARFNPAISLVLLATGLYMGSLGWWHQPWFRVALGAWFLNALLARLVVIRTAATLADAVFVKGEGLSERVDQLRRSAAWTVAARVMLATDFALLFIMLNKPGLSESLLVLAGSIAALAVTAIRSGRISLSATVEAESMGN